MLILVDTVVVRLTGIQLRSAREIFTVGSCCWELFYGAVFFEYGTIVLTLCSSIQLLFSYSCGGTMIGYEIGIEVQEIYGATHFRFRGTR